MKKPMLQTAGAVVALLSIVMSVPFFQAFAQGKISEEKVRPADFVSPVVFQAAGPNAASIQSTVDAYRAALGGPVNGNTPGPLGAGRREINWDGGSPAVQATTISGNPFAGFQVTRGALFTTPDGTGFVQAPATADPILFAPGGLAGVFNNPTYATAFSAFSPSRLFSAIGGKVTEVDFFIPGGGAVPAVVTGFGSVFTDVDQADGSEKKGRSKASTLVEYFGVDGTPLFSSFVPASPGDGSLSFFGIVFHDARIAHVRITSGTDAPGPDDGRKHDVVMMDDFIYGEPQPLP